MNVLEAIQTIDMGFTSFSVERITYQRRNGSTSSSSETIVADGDIHPGTPEMLQALPEEDRNETFIRIFTAFPCSTGENNGGDTYTAPDRITYAGKVWRVIRVRDWSAFGYYEVYAVSVCD